MKTILRDSVNPGYSRNAILILIALIFYHIQTFSQISGTLTIGGDNPDYVSFTQAVESLHNLGVNGPVVFNVRSAVYEEQIILGNIPGSSATNTVVFQSETGDSSTVTIQYSLTDVNNNFVVMIDGGKFITFSGMTFKPSETSDYGKLIELKDAANNITFKNNLFLGIEKGSLDTRYSIIRGDDPKLKNISIINNKFNNCAVAVILRGEGLTADKQIIGSKITGNIMTNCGYAGVYSGWAYAPVVTHNQIESKSFGIVAHQDDGNGNYSYNRIKAADTGIDILRLGKDPDKTKIVNNFIAVINPVGELHGININNSIKIEILFNNVYLNTTYKLSSAFYATAGDTGVVVQNNNFVSENTGFAVYVTTPGAITTMSHNNLFSEGNYIAKWGDDFIFNIYDLQSVSGMNDNSLSVYPHFISDSDLHVVSPWLNGRGIQISDISDDIDGNEREKPPDIGADEYTPNPEYTNKLSGTYTIGGTGARNYEDFSSAINDAFIKGISDAVTFRIQSGTYNEQIKIRNIPGSSPENTVTFTSATDKYDDVKISWASSSATENYVISFHASDFIKLENVSMLATGNQNAIVINISEGCDSIEISNNSLEGRYSASANVRFSIILSEDCDYRSRIIQGNIIKKCSYGIYMKRESSGLQYPRGAVIKENEITECGYSGIYLQHHDSPLVTQNTISSRSGIELRNSRGPAKVIRNKISSVTSEGINIYHCQASAEKRGLIANNFIQGGGTSDLAGISMNNAEHYSVLYNSVNITGSNAKANAFYTGSLTSTRLLIKNNIFYNKGGGYSYYVTAPSTIVESDYNDLFTLAGSNLAYWGGSNCSDLSSLREASGMDQHSVSVNPNFVSDTDLHTTEPQLDRKGTPVPGEVTEDIDGRIRDKCQPDIGAVEFGMIKNSSIAGELWDKTDMSKPAPVTRASIILYPQGNFDDTKRIELDGSNEYLFYCLEDGNYTVLAIPDETLVDYLPTYHGNKLVLYEADWIGVSGDATGKDIELSRKPAPRFGSGIIKGKITQGNKSGIIVTEKTGNVKGDAVAGFMAYLKGATEGALIASDRSGADGSFSFDNLENGEYYFVADCQGKPMDPANPSLTISDDRKSIEILAAIGSENITVTDLSTGLDETIIDGLKVYPLPATDYIMLALPESLFNGKSVTIRIFDLSGHNACMNEKHDVTKGTLILNLESLSNGFYILEIDDKVTIQRVRIVKMN